MFYKIVFILSNFLKNIVISVIDLYQKTISPDHGLLRGFFPHGYCRFTPTCSQYGKDAVIKYGVIVGLIKTVWRILRCNPFNKGGHDPVK